MLSPVRPSGIDARTVQPDIGFARQLLNGVFHSKSGHSLSFDHEILCVRLSHSVLGSDSPLHGPNRAGNKDDNHRHQDGQRRANPDEVHEPIAAGTIHQQIAVMPNWS